MNSSLPPFGPGYDPVEALEILRLAAAVSAFVPRYNPDNAFAVLDPTAPAAVPPIVDTLPSPPPQPPEPPVMPSLFPYRWPAGWVAGLWTGDAPTWERSIIVSYGEGARSFANQALLAYNPAADAYCLSFRGTMTPGNALEDLGCLLVPAGPITADDFKWPSAGTGDAPPAQNSGAIAHFLEKIKLSNRWYCPDDIPGVSERARVHGGFRVALESLDFAAVSPVAPANLVQRVENIIERKEHTLTGLLEEIGRRAVGRPIKIYVTGHSLGAGMASLCAAWLQTQPIANATFRVKLYAFAQPKPGNDYFSYAQGVSFGPGWTYAVINTLDTIPQVGLTLQNLKSLNYQGCISFLTQYLGPLVWAAEHIPPFNFVHMGDEIILEGGPIVANAKPDDLTGFYDLPSLGLMQPAAATATESDRQKSAFHLPTLGKKPAPTPPPEPTPPVKMVYKFPAYLFQPASSDRPNDYVPPSDTWTVTPYADVDSSTLGMFAPLWQHMPWIYQQALVQQIQRAKPAR